MSVRVQPGGMFNSYKVKYSQETHDLLKVLMEEVKLTTAQRSQMKESLRRGEPLPVVPRSRTRPSYVDENLFGLKKNFYFARRSQDQIVQSGAYEKDRYRFLGRTVDLEKEKERLCGIMVHGKDKCKFSRKKILSKEAKRAPTKEITSGERVEELIQEIEDRLEFLQEMDSLGRAKDYKATIRQEIAAKIRDMKKLNGNIARKYVELLSTPKKPEIGIETVFFHR